MSKKSAIRHHVRTNPVVRVVYRIICIILVIFGIFGLAVAFRASEYAIRYPLRDSEATAKVTGQTKTTDKYNYESCLINYEFTVDGKKYSSEGVQPNNYSCHVEPGDEITIRYQASNPSNNTYGDSEDDESLRAVVATSLTFASIIPLGIGFVGLIAIHKAMKEEDEVVEEEEEAAEAKARRAAAARRRRSRKATNQSNEQE